MKTDINNTTDKWQKSEEIKLIYVWKQMEDLKIKANKMTKSKFLRKLTKDRWKEKLQLTKRQVT